MEATMTERSKGPFTIGDGSPIFGSGETAREIMDASGARFALVLSRDCAGGDLTAAKARATRIAESLNKTEGHAP
jgi:hypothetical protein